MLKRYILWICIMLLLLGVASPVSAQEKSETTVVLAGSDFQNNSGHQICQDQMLDIFSAMKEDGHSSADGFLFCGDYSVIYDSATSNLGIQTLHETIDKSSFDISRENRVLIQGNHDVLGTTGLANMGDNDPESGEYGVFVIPEDKFMWYSGTNGHDGTPTASRHEVTVRTLAHRLEEYLLEKQDQGFSRPIFVVSHLPLHYSMRTRVYGDSCYASYLFDVLNEGAKNGLNIVFLFGHNHSNGWDNHLGGASVFLQKGDTIRLSYPKNRFNCYEETLYFTYLNAGYVGYFTTPANEPVDKTLTMTCFEFDDQTLTITRYSKDGAVNLRAKGTYNQKVFNGTTEQQLNQYQPISTVAESPHVVKLISAYQPGKKATCKEEGIREHYYVKANDTYYEDVLLTSPISKDTLSIPSLSHSPGEPVSLNDTHHRIVCQLCQQEVETKEHTLTNNTCTECGYGRSLQYQEYKPATCQEDGWIEHYFDPITNTCYQDAQGEVPLSSQQVLLPKLSHDFTHSYQKDPSGHRGVCQCGLENESLSQHSFQNNVCYVCLYERPVPVTASTSPRPSTTSIAVTTQEAASQSAAHTTASKSTAHTTASQTVPHTSATQTTSISPATLPAIASTQAPNNNSGVWIGILVGGILLAGASAGGLIWFKRKNTPSK